MSASNVRTRMWCFTTNNPTAQDDPRLVLDEENTAYAIWSLEKGESGTPHLQGYIRFHNAHRFNGVRKLFPRSHISPCKGTEEQNIAYCSKDPIEGPCTIGEPKAQGRRNDWIAIRDATKESDVTIEQLAEDFPSQVANSYAGIMRLRSIFAPPRQEAPSVIVIYGAPGLGKTHFAREWLSEQGEAVRIYEKESNNIWWDLYDMQKHVLIDEFNGGMPFTDMKRLLDKYDYKGQCKGGYFRVAAQFIAITSNHHPNTWYDWSVQCLPALTRRVQKWYYFYGFKKYNVYSEYQQFVDGVMKTPVESRSTNE